MATIRDIVQTAFRWANITEAEDEPEAHEAAEGLDILNGWFSGMELDGFVFTTPIVAPAEERGAYTHSDWTLNDEFPFESGFIEGVKAKLACQLSELHGQPAPPHVEDKASVGYARLLNAFFVNDDMKAELPLQRMSQSGVGQQNSRYFTNNPKTTTGY